VASRLGAIQIAARLGAVGCWGNFPSRVQRSGWLGSAALFGDERLDTMSSNLMNDAMGLKVILVADGHNSHMRASI
jgi:hypothetical protein